MVFLLLTDAFHVLESEPSTQLNVQDRMVGMMVTMMMTTMFMITVLQVPLHSYEKPTLKLPSSVKQAIVLSHQSLLTRLAADQKKVRWQRPQNILLFSCSERDGEINVYSSAFSFLSVLSVYLILTPVPKNTSY